MNDEVRWHGAEALREHLRSVEELVPFPENPIDPQHVLAVAGSLRDFGQVRAVLTWENAEEFGLPSNTIVAGHHVWSAAQSASNDWTHVAAIPAHFRDREAAAEYLELDNILSAQAVDRMLAGQMTVFDVASKYMSDEAVDALKSAAWHTPKLTPIADLKTHERSTRQDPEDLIEHIGAQMKEMGIIDEVVVARDGTILKGENVIKAAALIGLDKIPVKRLDYAPDHPEALKIMALDYAGGKRTMVDDRQFAEMLKNLYEELGELEGTGYDPEMVANLMMVSRTASEIKDMNQAVEWIGLSEYQVVAPPEKLMIQFEDAEARELYMLDQGLADSLKHPHGHTITVWWPPRDHKDDPSSLRFVGAKPSDES